MLSDDQLDQIIIADKRLRLRYNILNKIGEGCFGKIYKAINRTSKRQVALKVELMEESRKKSNLAAEISILEQLQGIPGVPKVYHSGKWQFGLFMEMELLSSSLHDERDKDFSLQEVHMLAVELLQILRRIHSQRIIHQDLKPQNIMRNNDGSLVLIDFGLSSRIQSRSSSSSIMGKQKKKGFIGTPRYASVAAHQGLAQGPKDDIQSMLYVLCSLLKKKAPWFQLKTPISERLQKIMKYKIMSAEQWLKDCSSPFGQAFQYLKEHHKPQDIDYQHLINLFHQTRKTLNFKGHKNKFVNNRRNSDNNLIKQMLPGIQIIHVQGIKNTSVDLDANDISQSQVNFSLMAQDNCREVMELLTQKFFSFRSENNENQDTDLQPNTSEENHITDLSKYTGIKFKNPFSDQTINTPSQNIKS